MRSHMHMCFAFTQLFISTVLLFTRIGDLTTAPPLLVIGIACLTGTAFLPTVQYFSHASRGESHVYRLAGHAWVWAVTCMNAMTLFAANGGSGVQFAEYVTNLTDYVAWSTLCFAIGGNGALLDVSRESAFNALAMTLIATSFKLQQEGVPACMALLHVLVPSWVVIGYVSALHYTKSHKAIRKDAESIVSIMTALSDPYVVIDPHMQILAMNKCVTKLLGYVPNDVVGQHWTKLLADIDHSNCTPVDHSSCTPALNLQGITEATHGHTWSTISKEGVRIPCRITTGVVRCPSSAILFHWIKFSHIALDYRFMALEARNEQLVAEKERLQWEVTSQNPCVMYSHEALKTTVTRIPINVEDEHGANPLFTEHRTLGKMKDSVEVQRSVSNANSYDHVNSRDATPIVLDNPRIVPIAPPQSPTLSRQASVISLKSYESSDMDTMSQAAKKSPTRAPPPPKEIRLLRPVRVRSEPTSKPDPNAENKNSKNRVNALPVVEICARS